MSERDWEAAHEAAKEHIAELERSLEVARDEAVGLGFALAHLIDALQPCEEGDDRLRRLLWKRARR